MMERATSEHWRLGHGNLPRDCDARGCDRMALYGHVVRAEGNRWNVFRCQAHHEILLDRIARGTLLVPATYDSPAQVDGAGEASLVEPRSFKTLRLVR